MWPDVWRARVRIPVPGQSVADSGSGSPAFFCHVHTTLLGDYLPRLSVHKIQAVSEACAVGICEFLPDPPFSSPQCCPHPSQSSHMHGEKGGWRIGISKSRKLRPSNTFGGAVPRELYGIEHPSPRAIKWIMESGFPVQKHFCLHRHASSWQQRRTKSFC